MTAQIVISGATAKGAVLSGGAAAPSINLPTGVGWHPLSSSSNCGSGPCGSTVFTGSAADPGTVANALCLANPCNTGTTSYNFSSNLAAWFSAFSSSVYDTTDERLYVFGGGHQDSRISLTAYLDLTGGSPAWHLVSNPFPLPVLDATNYECINPLVVTDNSTRTNYNTCAFPMSRHTFNLLNYSPAIRAVVMVGGFVANNAGSGFEVWNLDTSSGNWSLTSPLGGNPISGIPLTALDPTTGRLWEIDGNTGKAVYYTPSSATSGAWTTWKSSGSLFSVGQLGYSVIDPVDGIMVGTSVETDGTCSFGQECDYWPNTDITATHIRGMSLTGTPAAAANWDDATCNGLYWASSGIQWDDALGLVVGYPGGGNVVSFFNPSPSPVVTFYGTVASHKCLTATIGSTKGTDYPPDPPLSGSGTYYPGINGRFAYVKSQDAFINWNSTSAAVWILRLHP